MENIMLDKKRKKLKIVDFGLSNTFSADCLLKTHCGSPEYAAPELFITDQQYGPEVDVWSLGINMFAMVTGRLPFSTPYSENKRQRLMQQIQNGLGVIHGREMAHLSEECQELLSQLIEPCPELRLPLLDIEIHPWLTSRGQTPFCPYQQPHKDLEVKRMIIERMACLLDVSSARIEANIHEYRLDDISAIYNLMMDQYRQSKGFWDMDHTIRRELKRPKTVEEVRRPKTPPPEPEEQRDPEEERVDLRTPTIIGMVRPSQKNPQRRTCLSADFELSAVLTEEKPRKNRAKTATFPQTRAKRHPMGNATTANSVLARYHNFGPPSSAQQANVYSCPSTSPANNATHNSCAHEQPIKCASKNCHDSNQPVGKSVSRDEDLLEAGHGRQLHSEGDGPVGQDVLSQGRIKQPIRKQPVVRAKGPHAKKDDQVFKVKTNAESAHDVKVVDMGKYFNYKHGYIIKETALSNSSSQRDQDASRAEYEGSDTPIKLCSVHREQIVSETASKQDAHPSRSSHASSPAKTAPRRSELMQQMQLPARPVNAYFRPHHADPSLQETLLLTKKAWHSRYHQQTGQTGRKSKEVPVQRPVTLSGLTPDRHQCNGSSTRSGSDSPRARFHTPVATLHSTEDCKSRANKAQGARRNAMPQRLDWKRCGFGRTRTEDKGTEDRTEDGKGVDPIKKLQGMMSRDSVHQKVPDGNIRVKSAKLGPPPEAERCHSPQRKSRSSGANARRATSSDAHKSCTEQTYKGPYIMDRHQGQHQRSHTHPASNHDRVVDLGQQHMFNLLQEAAIKFEDSLKIAEEKKVKQNRVARVGNRVNVSHQNSSSHRHNTKQAQHHQNVHGEGPCGNHQQNEAEGTVALQPGQRVQLVRGSLAINSKPPPVLPSNVAPEHVFNVQASRGVQPAHLPTRSKQGQHGCINKKFNEKDWDVGYRLERKVSDTIKRAGSAIGKTPDLLLNCT